MARVLLVDDDADQLEIRRLLAEQAGHQVSAAGDAGMARARFSELHPEVVVLDVRIPKCDVGTPKREEGLALIREFYAADPAPRVLVLSGWPGDIAGRPEAALVEEVLIKPVRSQRLLELLERPARRPSC